MDSVYRSYEQFCDACHKVRSGVTEKVKEGTQTMQQISETPYPENFQLFHIALKDTNRQEHANIMFFTFALLKRWLPRDYCAVCPPEARAGVSSLLVDFIHNGCRSCSSSVLGQAQQCWSITQKLAWSIMCETTSADRATVSPLLAEVSRCVSPLMGASELECKRAGVSTLIELTREFSNIRTHTTELGITWGSHEKCRLSFQEHCLSTCFTHAFEIAKVLVTANVREIDAASSATFLHLYSDCFALMDLCITWNFQTFAPMAVLAASMVDDNQVVLPTKDWGPLLLNDSICEMYWLAFSSLQGLPVPCPSNLVENAIHNILQNVLHIASLNGPVLQGPVAKPSHFRRVSTLVFRVLAALCASGAQIVTSDESCRRLLQSCKALRRLLNAISAEWWFNSDSFATNMDILRQLTSFVLQCNVADAFNHEITEAVHEVLSIWVTLTAYHQTSIGIRKFASGKVEVTPTYTESLSNASFAIFTEFVEYKLNDNGKGDDDDDESYDKEFFQSNLQIVSAIARESPKQSLEFLHAKLHESATRLQSAAHSCGSHSPDEVAIAAQPLLNIALLIIQLAAAVLADEALCEIPMIPDAIVVMSQQIESIHPNSPANESENPACKLIRAVMDFALLQDSLFSEARSGNRGAFGLISPLVVREECKFFSRVMNSYLAPNPTDYLEISPVLAHSFARGTELLRFGLTFARRCLGQRAGEQGIEDAALGLLLTLTKGKQSRAMLSSSQEYAALVVGESNGEFCHLSNDSRRRLTEALSIGSYSTDVFNAIAFPVRDRFIALLRGKDIGELLKSETEKCKLIRSIDELRGLAGCVSYDKQLQEMTVRLLLNSDILACMAELCRRLRGHMEVTANIMAFFYDLVRNMRNYSTTPESGAVFATCLKLISACNEAHADFVFTKALQTEESEQTIQCLTSMMKLFSHVIFWDSFDSDDSVKEYDAGQLCAQGLSLVLRLINSEFLQYPEVTERFFSFLNEACEFYPHKISYLDDSAFRNVIAAVEYALNSPTKQICSFGYRTLTSVASFKSTGNQFSEPFTILMNRVGGDFFERMYHLVLTQCIECTFDVQILPTVSLCVFTLLCVIGGRGQEITNEVALHHKMGGRIMDAFRSLVTGRGVHFDAADRSFRQRFEANFEEFCAALRTLKMR